MSRLILKAGYIKPSQAVPYMKYIATREGVETLEGHGSPTPAQQKLISSLIEDFPSSKNSFEYEDYILNPSFGSASALIATALECDPVKSAQSDVYMKYIATRPRVDRIGAHGLFSSSLVVNLDEAMSELSNHTGNVWTLIYSLRRPDAVRLGYNDAESWQHLINSHIADISSAMKIPAQSLRWYAAFHDEGHHPHVHMMVWSIDKSQGYLTPQGIANIKSKFTSSIFSNDLHELYTLKDSAYKKLSESARKAMHDMITQLGNTIVYSPEIENRIIQLKEILSTTEGKKVYGYLNRSTKQLIDEIVDLLAMRPDVAECYSVWNSIRDDLDAYYHKESHRPHNPLSKQKEFRSIKNIVIKTVLDINSGALTFEDHNSSGTEDICFDQQTTTDYQKSKDILFSKDSVSTQKHAAIGTLKQFANSGHSAAAFQLGIFYRDDPIMGDIDSAIEWFTLAAKSHNSVAEYNLAKLHLSLQHISDAIKYYELSAAHGNTLADYALGKIYLTEKGSFRNVSLALQHFENAATHGNQFAQYALGKLYLFGHDIPPDKEIAQKWLSLSAEQGNKFAQYYLDRIESTSDPSVWLAATTLLYHLSKIFQQNSAPPAHPNGIRIDSKRRKQLQAKRIAMGHREDDHEETPQIQVTQ